MGSIRGLKACTKACSHASASESAFVRAQKATIKGLHPARYAPRHLKGLMTLLQQQVHRWSAFGQMERAQQRHRARLEDVFLDMMRLSTGMGPMARISTDHVH